VLAVNQGSAEPPRLLKLTYEPTPVGDEPVEGDVPEPDAVDTLALVGKGITFDSGGLSLKPAESMMEMKCDMAGAAAVVATMCALPSLDVAVKVVSFTPMTDNMTGGAAQRPGDIYTARNGTTVEVLNTDAEGRLVLADALSLAADEEPDAIIDLATLTGACMVALGQKIAGLMGNDEVFSGIVEEAAAIAGERVWQLPLPADYRKGLDSSVADIKNIAGGRYGGALTAGLFLADFVDADTPWVHLDIAGPAFLPEADGESPKGATGFGVRTLLTLLESWGEEMELLEELEELESELD
jgi:leucyl aminopeptidase